MSSSPTSKLLAVFLVAAVAPAQQHLTTKEALELVFPDAKIERTTVALDKAQQQRLGKQLGTPWQTAVVFPYAATRDGTRLGTAYFDTHRVRGQLETLLIAIGPGGKLLRVEVVAFGEPARYQPKPSFYLQFVDRNDSGDHSVAKVTPVAGATLTVNATIAATRRALALHAELDPPQPPTPAPAPAPKPQPGGGKT